MAKLSELTSCFMEAFLKANPNSLVDSNGYLRSEYEAELARRKQPVVESNGVPDPRTYRPQFECTGEIVTVFETSDETIPAFESPDEQLGITKIAHLESDGTWLDDGRKYGPMIRADGEIVTPQLLADSTKWNTPLSVLVEPSQEKLETVADSIAGYDHYKFSEPCKQCESAAVEESITLDYIALDDITPEATIAQAESDAGIDGEPAASEPHE